MTPHRATGLDAVLTERLAELTLEQKVRLLTGADAWALHAEPAVGLRRLVVSDGPAGVRGETWDERDPSANVPSPTALAATWDVERIERIGGLLADEARRKGVDVLLAPTVNLHRTPYGGRHFECYSEDPLLTAVIGAAFVRGVQGGGVGATVKHYVANDSETERFHYDARIDERTLREVYLAPFEAIVRDAGAWAVMAAYNSVNGSTMTESPLQRDVLKGEWGFDGVVMSDWYATRSLAAAGDGLLDLVMPGPTGPWGDALVESVRAGEVAETAIDDKVLRILRLASRVGALDGIEPAVAAGARWEEAAISAQLRAVAAAGFVLARNAGPLLPLAAADLRRVAVLGPNAAVARTLGGGSATVFPPYVVSPLEGIEEAMGPHVEVLHATGGRASDRVPLAPTEQLTLPDGSGRGIEVRLMDADGAVLVREERDAAHLMWSGTIAEGVTVGGVASIELRTRLRAPVAGTYLVGGAGLGSFVLQVDGRTVLDAATALPAGVDVVEGMMRAPQASAAVDLADGQEVELALRHVPEAADAAFGGTDMTMLVMQLNAGIDSDEADVETAVSLAADADVAVVVVGTTEEVESEGFDRTDLALPRRQDELVRRVAAANPRTVVVVNAGAPVLLPWAEDVAAVLIGWFPGQEFGNALADVLLGVAEPGGRLPTTWPLDEDDHPAVTPVDGALPYEEGVLIGYRRHERDGRAVRYPFGHGLGYTDWTYVTATAPEGIEAGEQVLVTVRIGNSGERGGREIVQVYAARTDSAVERPPRWLAGFAAVDVDSGQEAEVTIPVASRALEHWDAEQGWVLEPGTFHFEIGRSLADLRLRVDVHVHVHVHGS